MSYLKKIGALFVSSALMASMLAGCGGSASTCNPAGTLSIRTAGARKENAASRARSYAPS